MSRPAAPGARFRRLLPDGDEVTAAQAAQSVDPRPAGDRPYLMLNMVATADGRATIDGRAGPIGNRADRELFHQLRTRADAVMVGAGTARVEGYRRLVRDPALRAQRERAGLDPDPIACIVSGRLDLSPEKIPLLADRDSTVAVMTASDAEVEGAQADMHYLRAAGGVLDLGAMLGELASRLGVASILCEGGPTLNGALLAEGLVDELFLSVAPKLAGGVNPLTIVEGMTALDAEEMELAWLMESDGHLFLRYRLAPGES